ncbi:ABC transporter ATP-binding protein [bacterium]|nr:ABC transporter ATP-binding protein [bacterium]
MIDLQNIRKIYKLGMVEVEVLKGIDLQIKEGEHISIMGPSGSGKTTLLNIIGCLDKPTSGKYLLKNEKVSEFDDDKLSEIRSKYIGFIFQQFNLIPQLNVIENISLPLYYQGADEKEMREKAIHLAELVGLADRIYHRPSELSGGQQQRVAIARALANDPLIILADEPTGNLDTKTGREIMNLLCKLNEQGKTLLVITHDINIANYSKKIIKLLDGRIVNEN